mmetsp:Transcript_32946/g.60746  ORF Transcript_32946/g.60746 Transcript_32946/m.60746 type:complete len:204 (+) Transcript_32946:3-614(+)
MDGLGRNNANVILLGATNLPMQMDTAMITRFEKRVHIPLPDTGAREAIVKIHLQNTQNELKEEDFEELARLTDGASGRDIKELVRMALHEPLKQCKGLRQYRKVGSDWVPRKLPKGTRVDEDDPSNEPKPHCKECPVKSSTIRCKKCRSKWMWLDEVPSGTLKPLDLCMDDFLRAHQKWRNTVNEEQLEQYIKFTKKFGIDGA